MVTSEQDMLQKSEWVFLLSVWAQSLIKTINCSTFWAHFKTWYWLPGLSPVWNARFPTSCVAALLWCVLTANSASIVTAVWRVSAAALALNASCAEWIELLCVPHLLLCIPEHSTYIIPGVYTHEQHCTSVRTVCLDVLPRSSVTGPLL